MTIRRTAATALTAALMSVVACSEPSGKSERIGGWLFECKGDGPDAVIVLDGLKLHYDDAWNMYVAATARKDHAVSGDRRQTAEDRSNWRRVADFIDAGVVPSPRRLLHD